MPIPSANSGPVDLRLRAALRSGEPLSGIFNSIPSPALVEMAGWAGFDFIIIDNEHGSAGTDTTEHLIRAARASGIIPIVRCFETDVSRALDMGASGVQVPMVQSVEQAERLAAMVRYPRPAAANAGTRGCAFNHRAAGYGAFGGNEQTERSNAALALIVMLETPEALQHAAGIAAIDGVDAVFIGPNDLAHTMGYGANWRHPEVMTAIETTLQAVSQIPDCCPGVLALSPTDREHFAHHGARFMATVSSSLIWAAYQTAAARQGGQQQGLSY